MHPFAKLGLDQWIQKTCDKVGYSKPTKIQELAIPPLLKKKHVIANAETGSGKTATFALPILQELAQDPHGIFALILTANRELAMQISEQLAIFGSPLNLRVSTLVGGIDFNKQTQELDRIPHIVVGTPGRTLDMITKSATLKEYLDNVRYLVLDEADRLFEDSILPDIQSILEHIPQEKQVMLATATLSDDFNDQKLNKILNMNISFERFCVNQQKKVVSTLKQKFVLVAEMVKEQNFISLLQKFEGVSTIIFVNTCRACHFLNALLNQLGLPSTSLHSGLKQSQRIMHLKTFRNQAVNILVATDVASRGLDIQTVDLVLNYDLPKNSDDYVHRVGRTARKGKRGLAISFVTQYDVKLVLNIEKDINEKLEELKVDEEAAMELAPKIHKAKKLVKIKMSEDGSSEKFDDQEEEKKTFKEHIREQKKIKKQAAAAAASSTEITQEVQEKKKSLKK